MAASFIDKDNAIHAYEETKKWFRPYFEPLDEFERLARNKPSDKIDPNLPKVTDGTLAAVVQENPKQVIQQVPSGLVECHLYPEYAKIADVVMTERLIPLSNRMGSELQKSWNMLSKAMTGGRSASYSFYTSTNGQMHVDWIIPYFKDILSEKGKVFAPDSNITFMRSWYQRRDIQAIIKREQEMMKTQKGYKTDWDLKALADFIEAGSSAKPAELQTPAEREKGSDAGGFEVIHAFQKGKKAEFYSFAPRFNNGKPLRTKANRDPRGNMPIDFMYCNIDLSNPMGRGVVELSGGTQNLIDQQMQYFQFMSTMEMAPPMKVWGSVNKASLKLRPNAIWDMGSNRQTNDAEPFTISNFALQNFPTNYGLLKSQILQLNNSNQSATISADSGNPSFSKTQAGVTAQQNQLSISNNYLRKQFEDWWSNKSETQLNIMFAEMIGKQTVAVDPDQQKDIAKTPAAKYLEGNELTIPYKEINGVVFHFSVNPESSEVKEDADNVEKLTEVYKILQSDPDPNLADKKMKLLKILIDEIGAEGTDDLFPELDEQNIDQNGQPQQAQPQQPQIDPQQIVQLVQQTVQEALKAEKGQQEDEILQLIKALGIKFNDLPESARQIVMEHIGMATGEQTPAEHKQDLETFNHLGQAEGQMNQHELSVKQADQQAQAAQAQPEKPQQADMDAPLHPEEAEIVQELLSRGLSEADAEQAIVMLRSGRSAEEIEQVLGAKYAQPSQ